MPQTTNRLSARFVETKKEPGIYADGGGLYLRIKRTGSKSWVFVWHEPRPDRSRPSSEDNKSKRRELGLGSTLSVSLARARERAREAREALQDDRDPFAVRQAAKSIPTFGIIADEFIAERTPTVRSDKSIARWKRCIGDGGYADVLRPLRVDRVTTEEVLAVLRPLWQTRASSAGLLRGYIEAVINIAKVSGHRVGDNPAAWKGHLALILPARGRLTRGHHAALPYEKIPEFMACLRTKDSLAASALELTILCSTRTSETLSATWDEIDFEKKLWTISAGRMKAAREHRIPLSEPALRLLKGLEPGIGFIFPGRRLGRPLSTMAMEMVLRRMQTPITVHGFRSTFRDWAGEMTDTPREVCEAALAHTVGNSAELAYRRGDALEKRRKLMEAWASYCAGTASTGNAVLSFVAANAA